MGNRYFSAISVAGLILLLAGCSKDNALDIQGNGAVVKTEGAFQPQDSNFNTFSLLTPSPTYRTEKMDRDSGRSWMEFIQWDHGKSYISVQYIPVGWFSIESENQVMSEKRLSRALTRFKIPQDAIRKIDQPDPRIKGLIASNENCSVGQFAKRLKERTYLKGEEGLSDVIVDFGTCSDNLVISDEEFTQRFNLMTPSEKSSLAGTYKDIRPLAVIKNATQSPVTNATSDPTRPPQIMMSWGGLTKNAVTTLTRKKTGTLSEDWTATFEESAVSCSGNSQFLSPESEYGIWTLKCNDQQASGPWFVKNPEKVIFGESVTKKGDSIKFIIGHFKQ